jgi:hypothetical protein
MERTLIIPSISLHSEDRPAIPFPPAFDTWSKRIVSAFHNSGKKHTEEIKVSGNLDIFEMLEHF